MNVDAGALRGVVQRLRAQSVSEGAGVMVRRTLGTESRRHLDPFLMLDHFSSDRPEDYGAGFPDHPHRGFITLTYMLDGHMLHRDSMGNEGDLRSGGAQWMKAASGVIHSEMPQQTDGLMRGFQLWINLPASQKMSDPDYQEVAPEDIPHIEWQGCQVRLLAGSLGDTEGPLEDPWTQLHYFDITLPPGHAVRFPLPKELQCLVYVFEGQVGMDAKDLPSDHLAILGGGDAVALTGGAHGGRCILVGGRPLAEPIVQYGPFVMNRQEEIEQAMADYRDGRLVKISARTRHART